MAIELQLDPALTRGQRERYIQRIAEKLTFRWDERRDAEYCHRKKRIRVLREKGVFISKLPKCFGENIAL